MKKFLKLALVLGLSIALAACSKNTPEEEPGNGSEQQQGGGSEEKQPQLLLVKTERSYVSNDIPEDTDVTVVQCTYTDDGKMEKYVSNQVYGQGRTHNFEVKYYHDATGNIAGAFSTTTYSYTGGGGVERDSSNVVVNAEGKITKATFFWEAKGFHTPDEILEYKWSNGKLVEIKNVLDDETYPISYVNGNITQLSWNLPQKTVEYTATFDDKRNPYSLISDYLIANHSELDDFIRLPEDNEVLTTLNSSNILSSRLTITGEHVNELWERSYTYEYNEDGYPTKMVETTQSGTFTTTYTYKTL